MCKVLTVAGQTVPTHYTRRIGKDVYFEGQLFSSEALPKEIYTVLDVMISDAKILNIKNPRGPRHPAVEYLVKKQGMKRPQWTRPFPIKEILLEKKKEVSNG